ncbi:MAG: hypothetical protein ACI4PW_07935 [Alphaproteobacteria bacterium]|jgi:hypothetical protein
MTETQDIQTELEKASSLLTAASRLMREGRLVSIASLKRMVDSICRSADETGYAACRPLKASMASLIEEIDAFGKEMEHQYGFLKPDTEREERE